MSVACVICVMCHIVQCCAVLPLSAVCVICVMYHIVQCCAVLPLSAVCVICVMCHIAQFYCSVLSLLLLLSGGRRFL